MNLFEEHIDWTSNLKPLINKYAGKKHPLNYQNLYQLLIMVLLSAQDSDSNINKLAPHFFSVYPDLISLSITNFQTLAQHIKSVKNYEIKAKWILEIANQLQNNNNIPLDMKKLITLKGIGRKSANVIRREMNQSPEGIMVDLHVIRVSPRIGLTAKLKDADKIEKQLILLFPKSIWKEIGMSLSFLGREICRPTDPNCTVCNIHNHCNYYKNTIPRK